MAFELQNFQTDVIEASEARPIVIDFWAEWCGPCRMLGPVIEKLAREAGDEWSLVKINTEEHPQIAQQFGIRGIPAVKMVYQGEVIAEFTGALPEPKIRSWLDEHIPGGKAAGEKALLEQVETLTGEGDRNGARNLLNDAVDQSSSDQLKVQLALHLLPTQPEQALQIFETVEEAAGFLIEKESIEMIAHLQELVKQEHPSESLDGNEAAIAAYLAGARYLFEENFAEAAEKLIEAVMIDKAIDSEGPRKACVALFTLLGEAHPVTRTYRRRFSMALY